MNKHVKNLNRLEFLITLACTGKCKHCSEGEHTAKGEHIDGTIAADMILKTAKAYNITSLMTFGGEPLLFPEEVYKIHRAAREAGIPDRSIITNGFFTRDESKIQHVAKSLIESGVNGLLLSVDAFHQETIPLEPVLIFAKALMEYNMPKIRVHPAWLVSRDDNNPYNTKTRELIAKFNEIGIETSDGNVIFPSGNALKYLSEYFDTDKEYENPYIEDENDIRAICVNPGGSVLGDNIYKTDIIEILENYKADE